MSKVVQIRDWRNKLRKRGKRWVGDDLGVATALRTCPEIAGMLRFNEFSHQVEFERRCPWRSNDVGDSWTDTDDIELVHFLQEQQVDVRGKSVVADAVEVVSRDMAYHPVRDYLRRLTWDQTPRLQLWLAEYLNAEGPADYLAAVGKRFMVSAVARVMQPGCQADHVLVLEGPQGIGKSTLVRILANPWTRDSLPSLSSRDAKVQLCGTWIVELAELAALRQMKEIEGVKSFITTCVDSYRPFYGRRAVDIPRQSVFIATTNESQYLRDSTGNRRFWPVTCKRIDREAITRDRDQLWAEAVHLYHAGEPWHLTDIETDLAKIEQQERQLVTELEQQIADYLERISREGTQEVDMRRILVECLHLEPDRADYAQRAGQLGPQAAQAMQRLGWHRVRTVGRGRQRRALYRPIHKGA